jgi:hypothetical protein
MSQMGADEQEERLIFLFLAHLRASATFADTLSFSLLFLAQPLWHSTTPLAARP